MSRDSQDRDTSLEGGWAAQLLVSEPMGSRTLLTLKVEGEEARALAEPREWPERLWMRWPAKRMHWFDAASGRRIDPSGS